MVIFRKQEDCPASQVLLAFQLGTLAAVEGRSVASHVRGCEFCAAEIEFYQHYPQGEETAESEAGSNIPEPLYELAESILNRGRGAISIKSMLADIDLPANKQNR